MLTLNKTKKKNEVSFSHRGRMANTDITVRVNDNQKAFIERNINKIHFDINTMAFYLTNYKPETSGKKNVKSFRKISLNKALYIAENGKVPNHRCNSLTIIR
jgi:hypothetical protein